MMMRSSSFKSPKSYLYGHNLKNRKAVLLRYVIFIRSTSILYHKLPKSPVFLQATIKGTMLKKYELINFLLDVADIKWCLIKQNLHYSYVDQTSLLIVYK